MLVLIISREFAMYMATAWYGLIAKEGSWDSSDSVKDLDGSNIIREN